MNPDDLYDLLDQAKQEEKLAYQSFKHKFPTSDEQMEFLFCEWLRTNKIIHILLNQNSS